MNKIKELWQKVEDWYYDVCDTFGFLVSVYAVTVTVTVILSKWMYNAFYVKPIKKLLDK